MLEIGCGTGEFGYSLKRNRDLEVWGIEVDERQAAQARGKIDRVICADIQKEIQGLPADHFDCVVFNDVIEHLWDPWEVLRKTQRYLTETGVVVASIPNIRYFHHVRSYLLKKEWRYVDEGLLDITHVRFFTQKSIQDLFEVSGYEIIRLEGINETHMPLYFRALNRMFNRAIEDMRFRQFACVARRAARRESMCESPQRPL